MMLDLYSDVLPFGKYKGKTIGEVVELKDFGYLLWLDTYLDKQRRDGTNPTSIVLSNDFIAEWSYRFERIKGYSFRFDKYNLAIARNKKPHNDKSNLPDHAGSLALQDIDYASENGCMEHF